MLHIFEDVHGDRLYCDALAAFCSALVPREGASVWFELLPEDWAVRSNLTPLQSLYGVYASRLCEMGFKVYGLETRHIGELDRRVQWIDVVNRVCTKRRRARRSCLEDAWWTSLRKALHTGADALVLVGRLHVSWLARIAREEDAVVQVHASGPAPDVLAL